MHGGEQWGLMRQRIHMSRRRVPQVDETSRDAEGVVATVAVTGDRAPAIEPARHAQLMKRPRLRACAEGRGCLLLAERQVRRRG